MPTDPATPLASPPPPSAASSNTELRVREVGLPAAVILAVVGLIGALIPLAVGLPTVRGATGPYWTLVAYLLVASGVVGGVVGGVGSHPIPLARSRREAALVLVGLLCAGLYVLGLAVYLLPQLLGHGLLWEGGPKLSLGQGLSVVSIIALYVLGGGMSAGIGLHLWLARRQLPRSVARFASGGVAVAAVLAGVAIARHLGNTHALAPLFLFVLGALVMLPCGVWVGARLLPHGR